MNPRRVDALKGCPLQDFSKDAIAGVTVGIAALSLSMALGTSSTVARAGSSLYSVE